MNLGSITVTMKGSIVKNLLPCLLLVIAALGLASPAAAATGDAKPAHKSAKDTADVNYKIARDKCDAPKDHDKNACIAEAQAGRDKAKAVAKAKYKGMPTAQADADYTVAKVKCEALKGTEKDVCIRDVKAKFTHS